MWNLEVFRKQKDEYFAVNERSPLTEAQKKGFRGLSYFPDNPALRFMAMIKTASKVEAVTLQTSSGDSEEFLHIGSFRFMVNDEEAVLQIYESDDGYFIPFVDATSPAETYGAGRYLNAHGHNDGTIHLDFNMAYNPFCAYNERWSCPLPPKQNRLSVRIEAGEKKYLP